jgi:exodeoxyribonuclease VII small subunit
MSKTIDFEKSLKRLERIVQELEKGNLSLDEALKRYEEGIEFAKGCSKVLKEAKSRVEKLVKKEGNFISKEFQPQDEQDVS